MARWRDAAPAVGLEKPMADDTFRRRLAEELPPGMWAVNNIGQEKLAA